MRHRRKTMIEELRRLTRLGLPVVGGQLGMMLLHTVDTLMLGRHSVEALAAAALGTQWIFFTLTMGMGLVMGIDPLVAQYHGAGDARGASRSLIQGVVLAGIATIFISFAWWFTEPVLLLLRQKPHLARLAHEYVILQIPSVFFFLGWVALKSYLQGREIVLPSMWVMVPVNLLNVLLNWLFIFGPGPFPEWGLAGAAQATNLSRILTGLLLLAWTVWGRLYEGGWERPSIGRTLSWSELKKPLLLGLPISLQMGFEVMAFAATALVVGTLGEVSLGAHSIVLSFAALLFMIPLGVSFGATTRVGNLIGAGKAADLGRTFRAVFVLCLGAIAINVTTLVAGRSVIAQAYSKDSLVVAAATQTFVVAAAFQVSDCIQVVASGILRGMGRTQAAAVATFLGYYVFGIPWGYYLGIVRGRGLTGLWWGLALGLTMMATFLVLWLFHLSRSGFAKPHAAARPAE